MKRVRWFLGCFALVLLMTVPAATAAAGKLAKPRILTARVSDKRRGGRATLTALIDPEGSETAYELLLTPPPGCGNSELCQPHELRQSGTIPPGKATSVTVTAYWLAGYADYTFTVVATNARGASTRRPSFESGRESYLE